MEETAQLAFLSTKSLRTSANGRHITSDMPAFNRDPLAGTVRQWLSLNHDLMTQPRPYDSSPAIAHLLDP